MSRALRQELIDVTRRLHDRRWVANHDGNITIRTGAERFLATPTATSKADVDHGNLIEVDGRGRKLAGTAKPFSELVLHLAVFSARADVGAVVHAHPPNATALACSGSSLIEEPFIAEAVVSLGASIPTVPFSMPGKASADALAPFIADVDAVLLANHGVLSWGADLELAYLRMELVEHLATIALAAQPAGGVRLLPADAIAPLLAKRAAAGLGSAADRATESRPLATDSGGPGELKRVIAEEIARALS